MRSRPFLFSTAVPPGDVAVICYDIRFPEWLRVHALAGAKVLFVSAQWPTPRIDHWKILLQARAIENQCFVIAVNRISRKPENFNGQSMVIEPWGEVLWTGAEDEELAVIDVDFSKVDEVRTRIPVYDDDSKQKVLVRIGPWLDCNVLFCPIAQLESFE